MKDKLEQLRDFAEAQIMYAEAQEKQDNKNRDRLHEMDYAVRFDLAERVLKILDED